MEALLEEEKVHQCPYCVESFSSESLLVRHVLTHASNEEQHYERLDNNVKNKTRTAAGEKKHKCDQCGKSYNKRYALNKHLLAHTGVKPYKCDLCDNFFSQQSALKKHIMIHTGEKPFECEYCPKSFIRKSNLLDHIRTHTGEKPFKCELCDRSFALKNTLDNHWLTHTGEKAYKCELCDKSFSLKSTLMGHIRTHTGEKPYSCELCKKRFSAKRDLDRHIDGHNGIKPYECGICDKAFTRPQHRNTHRMTHTGEKPHKCEFCNMAFIRRDTLRKHLKKYHSEGANCEIGKKKGKMKKEGFDFQYPNAQPDGSFLGNGSEFGPSEAYFNAAVEGETGEMLQSKGQENVFGQPMDHLTTDRRKEIDENAFLDGSVWIPKVTMKVHQCQQCDKSFAQKYKLNRHMLTHSGVKPFACTLCEKMFSRKDKLDRHTKTHTGDKPYKCQQCSKSFLHKDQLEAHVRTHTGERPFKCEQCGKSFSQKGSLTEHSVTHGAERPFKCNICSVGFVRKDRLKRHMIKRHGTDDCAVEEDKSAINSSEHDGNWPADKLLLCDVSIKEEKEIKIEDETDEDDYVEPANCEPSNDLVPEDVSAESYLETIVKEEIEQEEYLEFENVLLPEISIGEKSQNGERKVHQCRVCGKTFSRKDHHDLHMRVHTGEKPFDCEQCGKAFSTRGALNEHSWTHSEEKPLKCDICGMGFVRKDRLKRHVKSRHGKVDSSKENESERYSNETSFNRPDENISLCDATVKEEVEFNKENAIEENCFVEPEICVQKESHETDDVASESHFETVVEEPIKDNGNPDNVWYPMVPIKAKIQNGEKEVMQYHEESKSFSHKIRIDRLVNTRPSFACEQCNKAFPKKSKLDRHMKSHSGVKTHTCEQCNKTFSRKDLLNRHILTHSGVKPHMCTLCDKSFARKDKLDRHMTSHTENGYIEVDNVCLPEVSINEKLQDDEKKEHQCQECDKFFSRKDNLDMHMRIHTGVKPFKCEECGKCFRHRSYLREHIMTHTGEKPFKCEICSKAFVRKHRLKMHLLKHHGEVSALDNWPVEQFSFCDASAVDENGFEEEIDEHDYFEPVHCVKSEGLAAENQFEAVVKKEAQDDDCLDNVWASEITADEEMQDDDETEPADHGTFEITAKQEILDAYNTCE